MSDDEPALSTRDRALFETALDAIVIVDDAGTYVDVNEALCRILRGTREQLVGRPFSDFVPPELRDAAFGAFGELRSDGVLAFEFPLLRLDGTIVNLEWRSRANFLPGLHLCVAHDLAERDAAQRALRESDERYRAFVANSSEAIWRFELERPMPTHLPISEQLDLCYEHAYLAECNDAVARMYGFNSSSEIVGVRLADMLPREKPENVEYLSAFFASGYRLQNAESHEIDRDGNEKFFVNSLVGIVENGAIVRAWGTQRDVTDERRVDRERAALLGRLELLADVTAVIGSSLDYDQTLRSIAEAAVPRFADWCFIDVVTETGDVDRVAVQHSDRSLADLAVQMEHRYPTPADTPLGPPHTIRTGVTQTYEIPNDVLELYAQGEEHLSMLRTLAFRRGLVVPLIARGRTLGALSFAFSESDRQFSADDVQLAEDIGRRAGLAIDNARLYSELDRANRAKDDFLAMLSHELRTPMTATLGWATMLERGGLSEDLIAAAGEAIGQSTRAQARLIDDLLDVSRIVSGKMQLTLAPVLLADVIAAAVETIRPAADAKQIALDVRFQSRDARLNADSDRLQQVFWNLLSNAVKFTPRGGRVDVELRDDRDNATVIVRDTGEGIARELLPHIFERFRQGDSGASRRHGGLGLGLAIARNLVELHGGTLTAESRGEGRGATFIATLPALPAQRRNSPSARAARASTLAGIRVLLVEDDPLTRVMLLAALRQFGATVIAAGNANEAFDAFRSDRFDVLVSDIGLPGEDGIALIQRMRGAGLDVRAIAVTAYAGDEQRTRALDAGFTSWLPKPVDPVTLADEVKRVAGAA
jgi:PAS domain S-box-containing protein